MEIAERFWLKVDRSAGPDACWPWLAGLDKHGYGQVNVARTVSRAHRIAYELTVGPIPMGLTLDHLCRNPPCCNPAHLEPVTRGENVLRGESPSARNARKTECDHGHEFNEANTYYPPTGGRQCRACKANRARDAYRRKHPRV